MLGIKLPVKLRVSELNNSYQHNQSLPLQPSLQIQNLKLPDNDTIEKFYPSLGEFKILNNLDNCLVGGLGILRAYKSKEAHFTITLMNRDKKLTNYPLANVVIQLTCLTNKTVVDCQVTDLKDGSCNVSYTFVNTGKHHIMITIEGNSFPGSLFEINVSPPYATIGSKHWEMTEFGSSVNSVE